MDIIVEEGNALLYVLICITASVLITSLVYFKNKEAKELSKWQLTTLYILRFTSILVLSILLTSPLIKTSKRTLNTPIIVTAIDNSSSMLNAGDMENSISELSSINNILIAGLEKDYTIVDYTFGEQISRNNELQLNERYSDYNGLLNHVYDTHFNVI